MSATASISSFATQRGLANTLSRLPASISIVLPSNIDGDVERGGVTGEALAANGNGTGFDFLDGGIFVGAIKKIDIAQSRATTLEREFNYNLAGTVREVVPQNGAGTLSVTHTELYLQNLPEALMGIARTTVGAIFVELQQQTNAFDIVEQTLDPLTGDVGEKVYKGCWFTAWSTPQSIDTSVIAETASIQYHSIRSGK